MPQYFLKAVYHLITFAKIAQILFPQWLGTYLIGHGIITENNVTKHTFLVSFVPDGKKFLYSMCIIVKLYGIILFFGNTHIAVVAAGNTVCTVGKPIIFPV